MAEYSSSGIWGFSDSPEGPFRHGMVELSHLGLPKEIAQRFEKWIETYETQLEGMELDLDEFNKEGMSLATLLKQHVGENRYVEFQGEAGEDGLLGPVEICI